MHFRRCHVPLCQVMVNSKAEVKSRSVCRTTKKARGEQGIVPLGIPSGLLEPHLQAVCLFHRRQKKADAGILRFSPRRLTFYRTSGRAG
jgi:hypothetical protein